MSKARHKTVWNAEIFKQTLKRKSNKKKFVDAAPLTHQLYDQSYVRSVLVPVCAVSPCMFMWLRLSAGVLKLKSDVIAFQILDDEISADFYVAVPDMLSKLTPLKNKLRKKFPKSKRGTLSEKSLFSSQE